MPRWPPPRYHLRMEWDVPLRFAFRWCTDYRSDDAKRSKETYQRRLVMRSRSRVIYEDVWPLSRGWGWRRSDVTLAPPDRWHADSLGSIRDGSIDYRLTELPGGRTQFDLYMRRRPTPIHPEQPTLAEWREDVHGMWTNFAREMVRDYRRPRRRTPAPRAGGTGRRSDTPKASP